MHICIIWYVVVSFAWVTCLVVVYLCNVYVGVVVFGSVSLIVLCMNGLVMHVLCMYRLVTI